MSEPKPIRVLHAFHRMDRGGAETWIVNVMRHIDRERFRFDFLLESDQPGAYDDEIRALGGNLYHAGSPRNPIRYARAFRRVVQEHGPYDVIHSHVNHAGGVILALAAWQGIPVRIAHSHNDLRASHALESALRRAYHAGRKRLVHGFSTVGLAASQDAAAFLFGPRWQDDPRWRVLHCGIDLEPFRNRVPPGGLKASLGIPAQSLVLGHVGSFMTQKNHGFLLRVFSEVLDQRPDAWLLLVGDGPLRDAIEREAVRLGLSERVVFLGVRSDVPALMMGAMDCFVFPSRYEGLGLVLIEAQAAGLPCLVSESVPLEAALVPELITRLPSDQDVRIWRDQVLVPMQPRDERVSTNVADRIRHSTFDITMGIREIERIYSPH